MQSKLVQPHRLTLAKFTAQRLLLCLLLPLAGSLPAQESLHLYLTGGRPDGVALLPQPVKAGPELTNELDLVRHAFFSRTPEETSQAALSDRLIRLTNDVFVPFSLFTNEIGCVLQRDKLPRTYFLLSSMMQKLGPDRDRLDLVIEPPKTNFARWRPYQYDPRLVYGQPERNASYPSGHSTRGWLYALIVADLFPDHRDAILEKGRQIGWDRVRIGKHFPSDVWAGRFLGQAIWEALNRDPLFVQDLNAARAEIKDCRRTIP